MSAEILSLAFVEPLSGREAECEALLKRIGDFIARKQYGRDVLYRDQQNSGGMVLARYWHSAATRAQAQEDPEMHTFWREAGEVCRVAKVYEELTPV